MNILDVQQSVQMSDYPDPMRCIAKQERSLRMVDAIVNAAWCILEEHGREGLSTTSLELVSGVPKSTTYEYFPNLDAVVAEVFHHVIRQLHESQCKNYPLKEQTVHSLVVSVVEWVLEKHAALIKLDKNFYLRYSGFFDLWLEFDITHNKKNTSSRFIADQLSCCSDYSVNSDAPLIAEIFARSILLTTYALLRDNPSLIVQKNFKNILIFMCCAICEILS